MLFTTVRLTLQLLNLNPVSQGQNVKICLNLLKLQLTTFLRSSTSSSLSTTFAPFPVQFFSSLLAKDDNILL